MKKKIALIALLAGFAFSTPALALVFGGTNFGFMGYPDHTCSEPYKPYQFTDQYQVDRYNRDMEEYIDCINEYVDNAANDIKRIQESAQSAIDEANAL